MIDSEITWLRRTATPYLGQLLILSAVSVFIAYIAIWKRQIQALWSLIIIWPLFAASTIYPNLKYRVYWDKTGIYMQASGLKERKIRFEEITSIKYEVAWGSLGGTVTPNRPFRRIVVYGDGKRLKPYIDVSLRHFQLDDIKKLLVAIHRRRPDLAIPEITYYGKVLFTI